MAMFTLVESKTEIAKAQRKLESAIRLDFRQRAVRDIGYPGGKTFNASVLTDGTYWSLVIRPQRQECLDPRRWNWFGRFQPTGSLHISVEINTAYEARNDRSAGFFARDHVTGSIYLLHSGRVGGGTKGVGKSAFLAWSNERLVGVVDSSGGVREGVLVMPIDGVAASRSAVRYVDMIASFKKAVREGDTNTPEFRRKKQQVQRLLLRGEWSAEGSATCRIRLFVSPWGRC